MKEKKIFIQIGVTVDLDNEDLEDFLAYLPEKLSSFIAREDVIIEDTLYGQDIEILDEEGKIISADDILSGVEEVEEEERSKAKDIKTVKIELKNGDDPLHGSDWGFEEVNGMIELSQILPKDEIGPRNERKRTYFVPPENISYIEVIKPIE